jgi:glycosyltransferase involved in cell wall biosynthesis
VKLAIVVQRYGQDASGGAELHARYIAEHLTRHMQVDVLTTCARDYVTWRNELPAGEDEVNGVRVRRFPVRRERSPADFGRRSQIVFNRAHSLADELAWLESEGPTSPALIRHLNAARTVHDFFLFFSYRYYHAYHGARAVADRAVLVPTAERDPAIGIGLFGAVFRGVRALMYNSFEERAMIHAVSNNEAVPGVVVGVGSEVPARTDAGRFRRKHGIEGRFAIYVGRIDENKGCTDLFAHFMRYAAAVPRGLSLVLVGTSILPVPSHPRIRHLGYLDDQDKFDALAAADVLIMPSHYESLSMVALEAWALGTPVVANGRCDVLRGQCIRSRAGLYYENYEEFAETLYALQTNRALAAAMGENGREYFRRHYAWPVIERKYVEMLDRLAHEDGGARTSAMEPLPGWFARRRRTRPPAAAVMESLPCGPSLPARAGEPRERRAAGSAR